MEGQTAAGKQLVPSLIRPATEDTQPCSVQSCSWLLPGLFLGPSTADPGCNQSVYFHVRCGTDRHMNYLRDWRLQMSSFSSLRNAPAKKNQKQFKNGALSSWEKIRGLSMKYA